MINVTKKSDKDIKRDVIAELKWEPRVNETEIGVEVANAVVTLDGRVANWATREAAAEAAHRVHGVLDVANEIQVKQVGSPTKSDAEIAHAVRQALEWDVFVPDERIQSTVSNGVVHLSGRVDHWQQLRDAARAVRNLSCVRQVINAIEVEPLEKPIAASQVQKLVREALERTADREAERIEIAVDGDVLTLKGRVHSWAEHRAIVGAAGSAPGVRRVEDQLAIDPLL